MESLNIYFNNISLSSIIAVAFSSSVALFLISMKEKSSSTIHLGLIFIFYSFITFGYTIGFCLNHEIAAYHRIFTGIAVLPVLIHINQFFFTYPDEKGSFIAKIFLYIQYCITIIFSIVWLINIFSAKKIFQIEGQYWDLELGKIGYYISLLILIYFVVYIFTGIWRIIVTKGYDKLVVLPMIVMFIIINITPVISLNLMRRGLLDKETYHILFSPATMIVFFIIFILYINTTKDRSTFMSKIVSVSLVSFLLVLLTISYFIIKDKEKSYNLIHNGYISQYFHDNFIPPDLDYVVSYSYINDKFNILMQKKDNQINVNNLKSDFSQKELKTMHIQFYENYPCILYKHFDNKRNTAYIFGFNYTMYRAYINSFAKIVLLILGIVLIILLIGFPIFFHGSLIKPLKVLQNGLEEVKKGILDIKIPVKVEDEIGFLTHNFNIMVGTIKASKKEIEDYSNNLEQKVKIRTEELQFAMDELGATNEALRQTRDELWGEMQLAKKIQTTLLPKNPEIFGYEISAYMEPADEVGGDYYDIINVSGRDWIVIGDVSGHGVPAGLIMMMAQTAINVTLTQNPNLHPTEVLSIINKTLSQNIKQLGEDKYMTITVLASSKNGEFYFSGLHQDILIYRVKTGNIEITETNGMWLGIFDDMTECIQNDNLTLQVNDTLLLFTDGLTEAVDKNDYMFSESKLINIFKEHGRKTTEEIKNQILQELKGYNCIDDITIVILKRLQ